MQISKKMAKIIAKATIMVTAAVTLMDNVKTPPVQAHLATQQPVSGPLPAGVNVDVHAYTKAYLSIRPNPVGLGQPFLVNQWTTPAPGAHRKYLGYKMTITNTDGTQDTRTT